MNNTAKFQSCRPNTWNGRHLKKTKIRDNCMASGIGRLTAIHFTYFRVFSNVIFQIHICIRSCFTQVPSDDVLNFFNWIFISCSKQPIWKNSDEKKKKKTNKQKALQCNQDMNFSRSNSSRQFLHLIALWGPFLFSTFNYRLNISLLMSTEACNRQRNGQTGVGGWLSSHKFTLITRLCRGQSSRETCTTPVIIVWCSTAV